MRKVFLVLSTLAALFAIAFILIPEKAYDPYEPDAAYLAQVDRFTIPDMPPDWSWQSFETSDGIKLRWGETGNRNAAKASVIMVPGYTATMNMYGEHVDVLARRGFHVVGVDLRGQGGSERHRTEFPEKLWVDDFSVYSADLDAWIKDLNLPPGRPLILSGSSFGGHVVARAAAERNLPVDALYLMAPAFKPKSGEYSFEQALKLMNASRRLGKSKHYVYGLTDWKPESVDFTATSDCSSYPKRLYLRDAVFTRRPEQRVGGVTNQWGAEFFESSLHINNQDFMSKLELPVTIISAETDTFVENEDITRACREWLPDCAEVKIPGTGHCLLQENDEVLGQMVDELERLYETITSN